MCRRRWASQSCLSKNRVHRGKSSLGQMHHLFLFGRGTAAVAHGWGTTGAVAPGGDTFKGLTIRALPTTGQESHLTRTRDSATCSVEPEHPIHVPSSTLLFAPAMIPLANARNAVASHESFYVAGGITLTLSVDGGLCVTKTICRCMTLSLFPITILDASR